jgi:hypothetical protein
MAVGAPSCDFLDDLKGRDVKVVSKSTDDDLELDGDLDNQDSSPSKAKSKRPKDRERKKIGLGFSIYYSFADTIKSSGNIGSSSFSETDKTDPQFGLSLHYNNISNYHFGSIVSVDYEPERKIKSGSGNIAGLSYSGQPADATFSFVNLTTNIGYGVYDNSFVFAGINFPVTISAKNSGADYHGSIGFQLGAGYRFTDIVSGSLEYRFLKAKGTVIGTNPFTGQPTVPSQSSDDTIVPLYRRQSFLLHGPCRLIFTPWAHS